MSRVRTQLSTASSSLDLLQGTRARAMERKMRDIELIDSKKSEKILDLENDDLNISNDSDIEE